MIQIQNLNVTAGEKEILKNINLEFTPGKNYLILWKNGSGKSSLSQFLMGNPNYSLSSGKILLDSKEIQNLPVNERSNLWLFLSFQNVPEIPGVNLWEYLRIIYNNYLKKNSPDTKALSPFVFKRFLKKYLDELKIDETFLKRDLNVWFSGWEKRKIELLQAHLLKPKYIILDEIDSWLDIDAFKTVGNLLSDLNNTENSIIVITHQFQITTYLPFDYVIVLQDGKIEKQWGIEILNHIQENGFTYK